VVHDDSLGYESVLRPGGVNVMTSGNGIAHAEQTPPENTGRLNGVQLWTALPDSDRHVAAGFTHVTEVPTVEWPAGIIQLFAGSFQGRSSAAPYYSPLLGADVRVHPLRELLLPLDPGYEHAILVMDGDCAVDGEPLAGGMLYYLGTTRTQVGFSSHDGGRVLLIGGPPFPETILMWWNFVARTPEEIAEARADWEDQRRFGEVRAYGGARLTAPSLTRLARPNPVS
jgi:redox-sensitive bicupin YhaK (pirin superfamily)